MANITKKPSGRWQARVSLKGKAYSVGTFDTKKEAEMAAAQFEADVKPQLTIVNIGDLLEKQLADWKKHLESYEAIHDKTINSNFDLELETIRGEIERLEKSNKIYKNKKRLHEKEIIEKLPSFNIF